MTTKDEGSARFVGAGQGMPGAILQRALALPFAAVLVVRWAGETRGVVVASTRAGQGVGLLPPGADTKAELAELPSLAKVTAAIGGARVGAITLRGVQLFAHDTPWAVVIERAQRRVIVRPGMLPEAAEEALETLAARGPELLAAIKTESLERTREALVAALDRAQKKVVRRIAAIGKDLERVAEADALSLQAQWLVAEAARAPRGARSLRVTDWSSGEARVIELPLDPARSAREQVEALFKRARRIKRGVAIARERQEQAEARRELLSRLAAEAIAAEAQEKLEVLARRARAGAAGDFSLATDAVARSSAPARPAQVRRKAYRTFVGSLGATILVGRGGADNDELTLHLARPHDLWLHARGVPGAHVVVPLDKGHPCPPEVLVDAAHLAAHFSDARGELSVEIEHTPKRFLRKPRGSAPGLVVVAREKVLTLRVDPARLAALLATEAAAP
jgi:hypothetical protein